MIKNVAPDKVNAHYKVDSDGFMRLAMQSLLIEHDERLVLIDPGCGDFLPKRILDDYGLEIPVPPEELLMRAGYAESDITDVVFTHLHFDHGTAAFKRVPGKIEKRYENARYHLSKAHFKHASNPEPEEAHNFFTFFLRFLDEKHWLEEWNSDWLKFDSYDGHTSGMQVPTISGKDVDLVFATDLIPLKILLEEDAYCGYDMHKELLIREKKEFLNAMAKPTLLVLYHEIDDCLIAFDEKGFKVSPRDSLKEFK